MSNPNKILDEQFQTRLPTWVRNFAEKRIKSLKTTRSKYLRELIINDLGEAYPKVREILRAEKMKSESM